jgi:hypothetical protein
LERESQKGFFLFEYFVHNAFKERGERKKPEKDFYGEIRAGPCCSDEQYFLRRT